MQTLEEDLTEKRAEVEDVRQSLQSTKEELSALESTHMTINDQLCTLLRSLQRERWEAEVVLRLLQSLCIALAGCVLD